MCAHGTGASLAPYLSEPDRLAVFDSRTRASDGQSCRDDDVQHPAGPRAGRRQPLVQAPRAGLRRDPAYAPHVLGGPGGAPRTSSTSCSSAFPTSAASRIAATAGLIGAYAPILFDTTAPRARRRAATSGSSPDPDGDAKRAAGTRRSRGICTWAVFRDRDDRSRASSSSTRTSTQRGVQVARSKAPSSSSNGWHAFDHCPKLFMADLNANEASEALKDPPRVPGCADTFRVVRPDEEPSFTYHRFDGTKLEGRCSARSTSSSSTTAWRVLGAADRPGRRSTAAWPSDHYPVTADLAVSTSRNPQVAWALWRAQDLDSRPSTSPRVSGRS